MDNTINGRTPEEIKARIDYCRNVKTAGDCMSCPYVEDADVCASDFMFDSFDYIQHLERERDEARRDADKLKHAAKEATDNYFVMLRERDAAVESLRGCCEECVHWESEDWILYCDGCTHNYPFEHETNFTDNWQWRGVQEVNEDGKKSS